MKLSFIPFNQLMSKIVDNRGKTCPTSETGIPLIATNCIKNDGLYPVYENVRYISQDTYDSWFRGHPEPGDIIFVCKGSPGRCCWVPSPIDFCIAQDMVSLRVDENKVYPKYLFALLRSRDVQKEIDNLHVGSLIPHFKKGDFDKLSLPVPEDYQFQKYVGDAYFDLSEKIELNRKHNRTLEAIAQALFKHWFVEFEFPNENGKPYKSSGGTMKSSELGGIPVGWIVKPLSDVTTYLSRGLTPAYLKEGGVSVLNQKCIRDGWINIEPARRHDPVVRKITGRELHVGDVLINSTGVGTLGRVAQVVILDEPTVIDSHVTVVRAAPEYVTLEYLGVCLRLKEREIEYMAEGSTGQTELSRVKLGELPIVIPDNRTIQLFSEIVADLNSKRALCWKESETLSSVRNTLLPKLMSGELRVA